MAEISVAVPYKLIQEVLLEESDRYVKRIWKDRKEACILAAGDILQENGYLPKGTTYEAWGDQLWFSVDKGTNADLAHYFHEGIIYGPNIPIFKKDANGKKTNEILRFISPKGKLKTPIYNMRTQGPNKPAGVAHWTDAVKPNGKLFNQLVWRIADILEK